MAEQLRRSDEPGSRRCSLYHGSAPGLFGGMGRCVYNPCQDVARTCLEELWQNFPRRCSA